MRWQCHQLDHMQIIFALLQTHNHVCISPLSFTGQMPFLPPNQQHHSTCQGQSWEYFTVYGEWSSLYVSVIYYVYSALLLLLSWNIFFGWLIIAKNTITSTQPTFLPWVSRSLFNSSSGSCHDSDATWQEIGRTCGSACSSPHPDSRIAVLLSEYILPLWSI